MPSFSWSILFPQVPDLILLLFLLWFTVLGYRRGLVQTVGQLLGAIGGFWIAKIWALPITNTIHTFIPFDRRWIQVLIFIFIFLFADRLVSFVFWLVDRLFRIVTMLPFLSTVHALFGAIFGAFEGIFLIGSFSYVILTLRLHPTWMTWIAHSRIASFSQIVFYRILGFLV